MFKSLVLLFLVSTLFVTVHSNENVFVPVYDDSGGGIEPLRFSNLMNSHEYSIMGEMCPGIPILDISFCVLKCFDSDHSGDLSLHEMQIGFSKHLHFFEKPLAGSAESWVNKLDANQDGIVDESDMRASVGVLECEDFQHMDTFFCQRC